MELQHIPDRSFNNSFSSSASLRRSYSKLNQQLPIAAIAPDDTKSGRSRTRCCFLASLCCALVVIAAIALAYILLDVRARNNRTPSSASQDQKQPLSSGSAAIEAACNTTMYPDLCYEWLSADPGALTANPIHLAAISVKLALSHVQDALALATKLNLTAKDLNLTKGAIKDCIELMEASSDQLNDSIAGLNSLSLRSLKSSLFDISVKLSGTMGFQLACSEGLAAQPQGTEVISLLDSLDKVSKGGIIALGLVETFSKLGDDLSSWKDLPHNIIPHLRRLLSDIKHNSQLQSSVAYPKVFDNYIDYRKVLDNDITDDPFPEWLPAADRKLLQAPSISTASDATVAQDGSGKYKTIQEALNNVPSKLTKRYIIYIKKGTYNEYLSIPKSMNGLTLIGDGMGSTIITGSRSNKLGFTTYQTATVAISGPNFIARRISFRNTAGPSGYQAVAVRVNSDYTVFDTCSFEGYQDTLYALANRQFYTGCNIYGTVDFIFGNSIAVFQNCNLLGRLPLSAQYNTFTAQGRKASADPSGFSFQKCTLGADKDLQGSPSVSNYLGRPWQAYSRTVYLQCNIGGLIAPAGWVEWDATNPFTDTLYYGEYQNAGAGAGTGNRVAWKGVHPAMTVQEATLFTVQQFISGSTWLPNAQVTFQDSL